MSDYPTQNLRYPHVFVIARFDKRDGSLSRDDVELVATYLDQDEAERESARLNDIGLSDYSVMLSRLKGTP